MSRNILENVFKVFRDLKLTYNSLGLAYKHFI